MVNMEIYIYLEQENKIYIIELNIQYIYISRTREQDLYTWIQQ